MGEDIAPDVDRRIIELCGEDTLLTRYEAADETTIELHRPYPDNNFVGTLSDGPLVAELERDGIETIVNAFGYFDSFNQKTDPLSVDRLFANYGPLAQAPLLPEEQREFVESLLTNDTSIFHRMIGNDWSDVTYTGRYLLAPIDPKEIWETATTIYPAESTALNDYPDEVSFDIDRRDELVEATISAFGEFARDLAGLPSDGCYSIQNHQPVDVRDRAKELFVKSPPLTQTQAVSWALHELKLSQTRIADLRGKAQPTIREHLERAATHYVQADLTASAFEGMPQTFLSDVLESVRRDLADGVAQRRFDLEKRLVANRLQCPECGYDAGEWKGGEPDGDWVGEPNKFYVGPLRRDGPHLSYSGTNVECPECGHQTTYGRFESEWEDEHGTVKYNGPEYDPAPY